MLALLLLLPDLNELHRFPNLEAANARLGALIEQRYVIRLKLAVEPNERWRQALLANDRALRSWEALHEAHGGLAEGGPADPDTRQTALERLRRFIEEADWAAGRIP